MKPEHRKTAKIVRIADWVKDCVKFLPKGYQGFW